MKTEGGEVAAPTGSKLGADPPAFPVPVPLCSFFICFSRCKPPTLKPKPCDEYIGPKARSNKWCGYLVHPVGPFKQCLIDETGFERAKLHFSNCALDVCNMITVSEGEADIARCQAFTGLAEDCTKIGKTVTSWRKKGLCGERRTDLLYCSNFHEHIPYSQRRRSGRV